MFARLHAWWEGMEVEGEGAFDADGGQAGNQRKLIADRAGWPPARLAAAQRLFGQGCTFPDAEKIIAQQIKPLAVHGDTGVLDIAAGIGTSARVIAQTTGARVDGLELDPAQVETGNRIAEDAGLGETAALQEGGLGNCAVESGTQEFIYGREALLGLADKDMMFREIWSLLKPGGQVWLLDFMAKKAEVATQDAANWANFEKINPHLSSVEKIKQDLTASFLDVHVTEDISKEFSRQILRGLATVANGLQLDSVPKDQHPWIMWELKMWVRRAAILKAGNIGFYRIHASKAYDDPA